MCAVSKVFDHYRPLFPIPLVPVRGTTILDLGDVGALKRKIDDFREAVAAAEVVDRLTDQPDCADPEKAKLKAQVARLERVVDALLEERERERLARLQPPLPLT